MSVTDILKKHSPIPLSEQTLEKLETVAERLQSENKKYNLTSLTETEDIALLHFADCLQLFTAYDFEGKSVIDIYDVMDVVNEHSAGDTLELQINREGKLLTVQITLSGE